MKTNFTKNFSTLLTLLFLMISINKIAFPQSVVQEWVERYNGPLNGNDQPYAMKVDQVGNVYVAGIHIVPTTGTDYVTIKYSTGGSQLWAATYDGNEMADYAYDLVIDDAGNVYVAGLSTNSPLLDWATIKYNTNGQEEWSAKYSVASGITVGITIDGMQNIYVTGYEGAGTSENYVTIKYNPIGMPQWVSTYDADSLADRPSAITADNDGNVYVTGLSNTASTGADIATIKYNTNGNQLWTARYNGPGNSSDQGYDIAVDVAGNVYVTGYERTGNTAFSENYITIKYNQSGVQQWASTYNGTGFSSDKAYALAIDDAGNVYVTGGSAGSGTGQDYATIKYNSNGVQQWAARYSGPAPAPGLDIDEASSIAIDSDGNVYVTGASYSTTSLDYATIKYNANGEEQWVERYDGPGNLGDEGRAIGLDSEGNVYVTGKSRGDGTGDDIATIKYSQTPTGIQNVSSEIPDNFTLSQNYPNPFNPSTKIKFTIPSVETHRDASLRVTLKIYDLLGNEIATLAEEYKPAGTYEIEFNAVGTSRGLSLPSGMYFYRLRAGGFSETKKMVLLR